MKRFFSAGAVLLAALTMCQADGLSLVALTVTPGGGAASGGSFQVNHTVNIASPAPMAGGSYLVAAMVQSSGTALQNPGGPLLEIKASASQFILSWSATTGAGYHLEINHDLAQTAAWTAAAQATVTNNGVISLTAPAAPGNTFFRLRKP